MNPKAIVTMAKYGPVTRKAGRASMVPTIPVKLPASSSTSQKLLPVAVVRMALVYAPMA
jgi:hypothetical protein